MAGELVLVPKGAAAEEGSIRVPPEGVVLGRNRTTQLRDRRVSREQLRVEAMVDKARGPGLRVAVAARASGRAARPATQRKRSRAWEELEGEAQVLFPGDRVCLLHTTEDGPSHIYTCTAADAQPPPPPKGDAKRKRAPASDAAAPRKKRATSTKAAAAAPTPPTPSTGAGLARQPPERVALAGRDVGAVGLGTLPWGVTYPDEGRRPSAAQVASMVHAALDAGIDLFDTADTYCRDKTDLHYVEALLGKALASHPRGSEAFVATKGGMVRINEQSNGWRPWGNKVAALEKTLRASQAALGRPIDLWQLHHAEAIKAADLPGVVEMVARCKAEGLLRGFGLCNAPVRCIEAVRRAAAKVGLRVECVQNQFSLWVRAASKPLPESASATSLKGVLEHCQRHQILFMPHGALGGVQARKEVRDLALDFPALTALAADKGLSPHVLVLAWMRHQWPHIVHIVGTRTQAHVADLAACRAVRFTPAELALIDGLKPVKR